jgi:hypothetical protein
MNVVAIAIEPISMMRFKNETHKLHNHGDICLALFYRIYTLIAIVSTTPMFTPPDFAYAN